MAVHLATIADYLQRTTALLPPSGDSTVCLWANLTTTASQTPYIILDNPSVYVEYSGIFTTGASAYVLKFSGPVTISDGTPTASVWYHLAWTQSGTTQKFYVNGTLIGTDTKNRAAFAPGFELLGNDTTNAGDVSLAYCREWTTALTQNEIRAELVSPTVVKTTSLYMDCPFSVNVCDISGNAHHWTAVGAATFVTGPTLLTNTQASTAIDVTPPYSGTFKMSPLTGLNPSVWFTYTAVTGDVVIGTWAFTSLAASSKPAVHVWTGTPSALVRLNTTVAINDTVPNVPYSVPITAGTSYFFECTPAGVDVAGVPDLAFSTVAQPVLEITRGDLMVSDETFGFPVVALDPTTGVVKRHRVFSGGETADTQPDGTVLSDAVDINGDPIGLQIWDQDFILQDTIAYPANFHSRVFHIVSSRPGGWFVSAKGADTTHTTVTKMSPSGAVVTSWTITHTASANTVGICPSPDETILYYAVSGVANTPVQRWDLVNNIALTDLTAGIATYQVQQDIVVLSDGTVVVSHYKLTVTRDANVHHYSAAGALLHTYAFGSATLPNRCCLALDDPTSFWLWLYPTVGGITDGTNRYVNVVVATGAFNVDYTVTQYELGVYATAATATPTARFGPSFSCPFWVYPVTPTVEAEPVEYLIRRERWFPHVGQEQLRQFFSKLQIDLYAGNGISTGQGSDPLLEIDWSDDGGHTWSDIHFVQTGAIGAFRTRAILRRMGSSRDRVYRIACSDPVQWSIINGYLDATLGTS